METLVTVVWRETRLFSLIARYCDARSMIYPWSCSPVDVRLNTRLRLGSSLRLRVRVVASENVDSVIGQLKWRPGIVCRRSIETLCWIGSLENEAGMESAAGQATQNYFYGAEYGGSNIEALYTLMGGDGRFASGAGGNITVYVFDLGFANHNSLSHLELADSHLGGDDMQKEHGVNVLGVLAATGDPSGVRGVVPKAKVVIRRLKHDGGDASMVVLDNTNFFTLLARVVEEASAGSVIHLPIWGRKRTKDDPRLPVEAWGAARRILREAVRKGVHVVQSAGNDGLNLDEFLPRYDDSGSIMVAAALPEIGVGLVGSNYGKRVNLHHWGLNVGTISCHDVSKQWDGSTSAAASIVAGFVASVSAIFRLNERYLSRQQLSLGSPRKMRRAMMKKGYWPIAGYGSRPDGRRLFNYWAERGLRFEENKKAKPRRCRCWGMTLTPTPAPTPATPPASDP